MFETLRKRVSEEMDRERALLDRLRLDAGLLKLELREKKDTVLADLQKEFDDAEAALARLKVATEDKSAALRDAAVEKWDAFKATLKRTLD